MKYASLIEGGGPLAVEGALARMKTTDPHCSAFSLTRFAGAPSRREPLQTAMSTAGGRNLLKERNKPLISHLTVTASPRGGSLNTYIHGGKENEI